MNCSQRDNPWGRVRAGVLLHLYGMGALAWVANLQRDGWSTLWALCGFFIVAATLQALYTLYRGKP